MSGHGHDSGIEAAEERRDELEPGRVQQQGALRRPARASCNPDRQGACTAVELAARDRHRCTFLAVGEKAKTGPRRVASARPRRRSTRLAHSGCAHLVLQS